MATILKIPMNEATRIDLEDCFIDTPQMDARKFIFTNLKLACQDAKRSIRNRVTPINQKQEDGIPKQVEFSLKGVDLKKYTLPSDPNWLPKNLDAEDSKPIELSLGDNTMNYIKNFGQITGVRHEQFNLAEEKYLAIVKAEMIKANAPQENIKQWEKAQESIRKDRLAEIPNCIEQCVHMAMWPHIQRQLDQNDGKIFEKEFDEQYPDKPEPAPKPAQ